MVTLVFGGLGHVGSWISHRLAERGDEVVIFDRSPTLANLGLDYLEPLRDRIKLEAVDVMDSFTLFERMRAYERQIDAVIFGIAVIAGPTFKDRPFRNIGINTIGMLNVLEACRILGVPRFLNLSSGAVYGDQPGGQTEETPLKATDLYGATKVSNEVLAAQYGQTYGIDVRQARLYFVYGPGKLPSNMHVLYQAMFGPLEGLRNIVAPTGGSQGLDWTHVHDTAAGVVALLDARDIVPGEAFNISCGVSVDHRNIVDHVSDLLGHESGMIIEDGIFFSRGAPLDINKARTRLGFEPRYTDIREGLIDYRTWIESKSA